MNEIESAGTATTDATDDVAVTIVVNDNDVHADPEHVTPEDGEEREAFVVRFNFNADDVSYV